MTTAQASPEYHAAIAEGARHHAGSKTYSGSLLRPHKPFLTEMIDRLGCWAALDIGAGKGAQYQWIDPADGKTLEQTWGFDVRKYDPCWPPFAAEPEGQFDLVICTHTLSLIPDADLDWFTARLFGFATKAVFIAEKIGGRKKRDVRNPRDRAIGYSAQQWVDYLDSQRPIDWPGELVLSTREILPHGRITTRHIWRDGQYVGAFEAAPREET